MSDNSFPLHSDPCDLVSAAFILSTDEIDYRSIRETEQGHQHKYADLKIIIASCRDALRKQGIAVRQSLITLDGGNYCVTELLHTSGQWLRTYVPHILGADKNPMQAIGAAFTYGRRYGLLGAINAAPLKDDGGYDLAMAAPRKRDRRPSAPPKSSTMTLNDYGLTVLDANGWCFANGIDKKWENWPDRERSRFLADLKSGRINKKMVLSGEAAP